eukprot:c1485_g1_i1.p1 GENE.c1485_g1_i1~~c1485_g1_i1.p1  ORF type:complete len:284 (+),score=29.66 c1485_g1_i1:35-853(+)
MSFPSAPVLLKTATCDRTGILVSWIAPENCGITNFTLSWKAESWWQSASATLPPEMREFLISEIPANEKISVWMYSTNDYGSSPWSDAVDFVSSRDCGAASSADLADVSKIVDLEAHRFFDLIYTESFDKFIIEKGYLAHVEKISYEEKDNKIYKRVRVSPAIPVAIRNMAHNYMGGVTVTYEDVSVKHLDSLMIEFKIENVPVVGQYADTAKGKIVVVPVDDGHCKLEIYFDLRISYPVIGYYIAQVIRSQVLHDIGAWPELVMEYVGRQN